MRIFDAFSFFNEFALLDIRLHELSDVVDYFVLVEADKTHSGIDKPMFFLENKDLFSEFLDKIIYVAVRDMPITQPQIEQSLTSKDRKWIESKYQVEESWVRERHQRNCIMLGLKDAEPEDVIIIGDADEIVRHSIIEKIRKDGKICEGSNAVSQSLNSFYLNVVCTNMPWYGSKIIYRKYLDEDTPSEVRFHTPASCIIANGGWHYSWLGGEEAIKYKIKSYAHTEFSKTEILDNVGVRLGSMRDVLGRLYEYSIFKMDEENTPKYVLENQDKFENLIYKG